MKIENKAGQCLCQKVQCSSLQNVYKCVCKSIQPYLFHKHNFNNFLSICSMHLFPQSKYSITVHVYFNISMYRFEWLTSIINIEDFSDKICYGFLLTWEKKISYLYWEVFRIVDLSCLKHNQMICINTWRWPLIFWLNYTLWRGLNSPFVELPTVNANQMAVRNTWR